MQHLLTDTANRLARTTGFVQRQRKFTGALFAKTLVFGWLSDPEASLDDLAQTAATLGTGLTAQALDARFDGRFGERAARFLEALLGEAARVVVEGDALEGELVGRFNGVYLIDTTVAGLPAALADRWPGLGSNSALPPARRPSSSKWCSTSSAEGLSDSACSAGAPTTRLGLWPDA